MAMPSIDLNADLGEGGLQDELLIASASSVNIACGGHAGDDESIRVAIGFAMRAGVAIGAHPGYEDREHFGRRFIMLPAHEVADMVSRQVERMAALLEKAGAVLHHVKPHGALYLQADQDAVLAEAVAMAVGRIAPGCGFYVPPAGCLAEAGKQAGLAVRAEGFVDRRYGEDGRLLPRSEAGAVIDDSENAIAQALEIACQKRVKTLTNVWFHLPAKTLCVHGDGPLAADMLRNVRFALENTGFTIAA